MMKKRRVVVTGIGVVSALGHLPELLWKQVAAGESAIQDVVEKKWLSLNLAGLAPVKGFVPSEGTERFDRQTQFAFQAARSAFKDAAIDSQVNREELAVFLSSSKGGVLSFEEEMARQTGKGPLQVSENFWLNYLSSSPSSLVAADLGCKGPVSNFVSACASGAHSMMMAARLIQDQPDMIVLAGSTEASLSSLILSGFRNMGVLATQKNKSAKESFSPFDQKRQGFIAGEGSALLVLESEASAKRRGVPIYCELAGSAAGSDSTHLTRFDPTGESISRAIKSTCQEAQISLNEIDYVNLHGTATKENDMIETRAIKKTWQKRPLPALSATKPISGHLLGASGALEAVISILALNNQFVPPTLNLKDPEYDLDFTPLIGKSKKMNHVLSLSYGFGGHIGGLVFRKD